jgi:hypothetical protein
MNRMIFGANAARHPEILDVVGGKVRSIRSSGAQSTPVAPRAFCLAALYDELIGRVLLMPEVANSMAQT